MDFRSTVSTWMFLVVWAVPAGALEPAAAAGELQSVGPLAGVMGPSSTSTVEMDVPRPDTPTTTPPTKGAVVWPLTVLGVGIVIVLGLIIGLKVNAFLALIVAAIVVSLMAGGNLEEKISRVAVAFGESAGKIGIVIALAAVIGKCMLDSGAADRIVRGFLRLFGQRRAPMALMGSGYFLAIPVFFDTVFYLLVPLARSLYRKTRVHFLLYVLAIGVGGAITHTLVPPTPGPLAMAENLKIDVGIMILVGLIVAAPAAFAGLVFAWLADRWMPIPMRPIDNEPEPTPLADEELPPLWLAVAPVMLPVVLISANTVLSQLAANAAEDSWIQSANQVGAVLGNANLALLLSAVVAMGMLLIQRHPSRLEMAQMVETSLMSAGVIILITAGGGAFGKMLQVANVGPAIEQVFASFGASGLLLLVLGFCLAGVLKIAQGSSTVAMITGSAMLAGIAAGGSLGFHPVYLATAIGSGSLFGSWMNDSGFWIFARMSGLSEVEALKSWTPALVVLAITGLLSSLLLAALVPFPPFTSASVGMTP